MASLEMVSWNLQQTGMKKNSLTQAIFLVMLGCEELKEQLDSTEQSYKDFYCQLEAIRDSVIESSKEVDLRRLSLEQLARDLEAKEKENQGFREKLVSEFNLKSSQLDSSLKDREEEVEELFKKLRSEKEQFEYRRKSIEVQFDVGDRELQKLSRKLEVKERELDVRDGDFKKQCKKLGIKEEELDVRDGELEKLSKELRIKEEEVNAWFKEVEIKEEKANAKEKELESIRKMIEGSLKEVEAREELVNVYESQKNLSEDMGKREEQLADRAKELEAIEISIERRAKELDCKEEELELMARHVESLHELTEEGQKEIEGKEKKLELLKKDIEKRSEELDSIEKKLDSVKRLAEVDRRELDDRGKELELLKRSMENRSEELDSREKRLTSVQGFIEESRKKIEAKAREVKLLKRSIGKQYEELDNREKQHCSVKEFTEQWQKQLEIKEKELRSLEQLIESRLEEVSLREKELVSVEECRKELEGKEKELKLLKKEIEKRSKELNSREKQLDSVKGLAEVGRREVEDRWKELELLKRSTENRLEGLDSREKKLNSVQESIEESRKKLEAAVREVESLKRLIGKRSEELENREKQLCSVKEFTEQGQKQLEIKEKELRSLEQLIGSRLEEVGLREKELVSVEERRKELEVKEEELKSVKISIEKRLEELDSREKQCGCRKEVEDKEEQLKLLKISIEKRSEELDSREKQCDSVKEFTRDCYKEFRSKMKQLKLDQMLLEKHPKEIESIEKQLTGCSIECSPTEVFSMSRDGKDVQVRLNKCFKDHECMGEEISKMLKSSPDPAKLVLNAMEGFYPPYLKDGLIEFEGSVVRSSCILLLEHLARVAPQIEPCVRDEALALAVKWKAKMTAVAENWLEVLGFLHLLAAYGLASAFDVDEILSHFQLVAHCRQTPQLFQMLGFEDKIPGLIQNLKRRKLQLLAVKFICIFGLQEKFPPVPLLKQYVEHIKKNTWIDMSCNSQSLCNEKIEKRVTEIQDVIKCIVEHNLESEYPPQILEKYINAQKLRKWVPAQSEVIISPQEAQLLSQRENNLIATPMAVILVNMDAEALQIFLNKHSEDHELLRDDVSIALQMSFDPAMLVLEAIKGSNISSMDTRCKDLEGSAVMSSCVILLEELMKLSPVIKPCLKEEARRLAVNWVQKLSINAQDPLHVVGFLKLVDSYNLASSFDHNELLNLREIVERYNQASKLNEVLGFSNETGKNFQITARSSIDHPHCELQRLGCCKDEKGQMRNLFCSRIPISYASDPAKLVLDVLEGCNLLRSSYYEARISKLNCLRSAFFLLDQLMRVKPEIKSHVKEEAMKLALKWRKELVVPGLETWDVLAFLQLVASYDLSFAGNKLLHLLDIVCQRKQAPTLCRVLGLTDNMPNFIQNLLQKDQQILALRYIYEFNLVRVFPPVDLLKCFLRNSKAEGKRICKEGNCSLEAKNKSITKEVRALRTVIRCIQDYGLQHEYYPENLEACIRKLEKKRKYCNMSPTFSGKQQQDKKNAPNRDPDSCHIASDCQQDTRKCPASASDMAYDFQMPLEKRLCPAVPTESFSNPYSFHLTQTGAGMHMEARPFMMPAAGASMHMEPERPFVMPAAHCSMEGWTPAIPHKTLWQYGQDGSTNGADWTFGSGIDCFRLGPN